MIPATDTGGRYYGQGRTKCSNDGRHENDSRVISKGRRNPGHKRADGILLIGLEVARNRETR